MLHRANSARVAAAALLGRAPPAIRPSTAQPTASSSQQPFSSSYPQPSFAFNLPSSGQPSHARTGTGTGRVRYKPNKLAVQFFGKDGRMRDGADVHKAFVRKAVEYVPLVLGERYRDAILTCLNALDGSFGSERLASVYLSGTSGAQTSEDREFKEMLERLREVERSRGRTPEPSQNKGKKGKKKEVDDGDAEEDPGAGANAEGRTREVAEACAVLMRVGTLLDEIQL
ncbi:hypothetical protein EXIGLDRAFT_736359 [Exidia glandulosa HHB12029]|uniref:Uncharacterized protein n=1 Tax=Exidia glandulosa HHB12029 TaxID=1314781 RepID=A0A165JF32_EXIGL|nr:hypothetical protein EXIGLDRAFT_736359 [Exidia glandulosa HHB12029]